MGFALALHSIVRRIQNLVPSLLINSWYLDNGTLCGSLDDLAAALSIIEAERSAQVLVLNQIYLAPLTILLTILLYPTFQSVLEDLLHMAPPWVLLNNV